MPVTAHTISNRAPSATRPPLPKVRYLADSEGFEPPRPLRVHLISNQAPSTARPAVLAKTATSQKKPTLAIPHPHSLNHVRHAE